ncbi:MAG: hypothetical protein M3008_09365 [Chloroflexota bacterium]|nr:hypothetical protein [Chloroflexota bacterium]
MRLFARIGLLILLLLGASPILPVRADSTTFNDPHGRWSVVLPDSYRLTNDQYYIGIEDRPGFNASATFTSEHPGFVSVRYAECCSPSPSKLAQITQQGFESERQLRPDAVMGPDGIQPTTLAGNPALHYDYFETDNGILLHGRDTRTFSGGLEYGIAFLSTNSGFDSMANDIAMISDSFRFTVRSVMNGIYSDPQGRFMFMVPPQYDVIPNFFGEESDNSLSTTTLAPDPKADGDTSAHIILYTFKSPGTFDDLYNLYATKGLDALKANPHVDGDSFRQRHISLDGHPAGMQEFVQSPKFGVRIYTIEVFAIHNDTQYLIAFALPQSNEMYDTSVSDGVISSFHFPVSA